MTDNLSDLRMLCACCTELCSTAEGDAGGSNDTGLNDGVLLPYEGLSTDSGAAPLLRKVK